MDPDHQDIRMPQEGMSTLVTQYTKKQLDRWGEAVRQCRDRGESEIEILKQLRGNLRGYDPATISKIYHRALGHAIPDDFVDDNIARVEPVKENTVRLHVKSQVPDLDAQSLAYWKGEEWYVQWVEGGVYTLKRVL